MLDVNARINWIPGMEISANTFLGLTEQWDFRQQLALQAALGSNRTGLIPNAPFHCKAVFVNNQLEMENLQCMALLPSGRIVNAIENVQLPIPMLSGSRYYLTIGFDDGYTEFEKEGVPFVRPRYAYAFLTREEVEKADVFPLMRLQVDDGAIALDQDYIPPSLLLTGNEAITSYLSTIISNLSTITSHQNLAEGEGKRSLRQYLFKLKSLNMGCTLNDFILLTHEIANAVDYYIVTPNREQPIEIPMPSLIDIQKWLQWLCNYLKEASIVLDGVVLEDNSIDFEALLEQAKRELYERLNPELTTLITESIRTETERIRNDLDTYINGTLKPEMQQELHTDLNTQFSTLSAQITQRFDDLSEEVRKSLYKKLYPELFEDLYNALYVPEQEDKNALPLI